MLVLTLHPIQSHGDLLNCGLERGDGVGQEELSKGEKERRMDFEATRLRRHPQCIPTLGKRDIFGFFYFLSGPNPELG